MMKSTYCQSFQFIWFFLVVCNPMLSLLFRNGCVDKRREWKMLRDNAGISEGMYYLKLSIRSIRSGYGRKCSFSSEGDSHVFVEIFSVLIVCVTRSIGCY